MIAASLAIVSCIPKPTEEHPLSVPGGTLLNPAGLHTIKRDCSAFTYSLQSSVMLLRLLPVAALLFSLQFTVVTAASSGKTPRLDFMKSGLSTDSATPVRLSLFASVNFVLMTK